MLLKVDRDVRVRSLMLPLFSILILAALLFARHPSQLLTPQIWIEEGKFLVPAALANGLWSVVEPLNGYLIVVPRFITWLALNAAGLPHYPGVAERLAFLFNVYALAAFFLFPTHLRNTYLMGIGIVCLPFGQEVFSKGLYTFWLATLLFVPVLFWKGEGFFWRLINLLIAAFSGPMVAVYAPLFWARLAIVWRNSDNLQNRSVLRHEMIICGVTTVLAILQGYIISHTSIIPNRPLSELVDNFPIIANKYFAQFVWADWENNTFTVAASVFLLVWAALVLRESRKSRLDLAFTLAALVMYGLALVASVRRVDSHLPNVFLAGPRYYFLPFIGIWCLLCYHLNNPNHSKPLRGYTLLVFVVLLVNISVHWQNIFLYKSIPLDWKTPAKVYVETGKPAYLPAHFFGNVVPPGNGPHGIYDYGTYLPEYVQRERQKSFWHNPESAGTITFLPAPLEQGAKLVGKVASPSWKTVLVRKASVVEVSGPSLPDASNFYVTYPMVPTSYLSDKGAKMTKLMFNFAGTEGLQGVEENFCVAAQVSNGEFIMLTDTPACRSRFVL